MMEHCPMKFYLLEIMNGSENGMWTDEIVAKASEVFDMKTEYQKDMINYDVIELVSAGLLNEGESKFDEDGRFKKDHILTHYTITPLGRSYYQDLVEKVSPRK